MVREQRGGILPLTLGSVRAWLAKVNGILLPVYVIGMVAAVVVAAVRGPSGSEWLSAGIGVVLVAMPATFPVVSPSLPW